MLKYTLHVHNFAAQAKHLATEPARAGTNRESAVDDEQNPTRVTVYTPTGAAAALRIAQRHLNHVHARNAYADPGITRTAADIVYCEARARAEGLTPEEREDESLYVIHSEYDSVRMYALDDVRHARGEVDA
ncbi:hypothetical protein [Streptomyces sp. NPDC056304]|uniref:hypothetical protein n=1 Tax=Streptomyces sp. NPDC056304 TaxID=3345778 RepID=UPI0035DB2E88